MMISRLASFLLLLAAPLATVAQTANGEPPKLNVIAIAMFSVFVAISLGITVWAAFRTKNTSDFLAAGGRIVACAPCCKKRDIEQATLFDGIEIAGGAVLVEWLSNGSPNVSY